MFPAAASLVASLTKVVQRERQGAAPEDQQALATRTFSYLKVVVTIIACDHMML